MPDTFLFGKLLGKSMIKSGPIQSGAENIQWMWVVWKFPVNVCTACYFECRVVLYLRVLPSPTIIEQIGVFIVTSSYSNLTHIRNLGTGNSQFLFYLPICKLSTENT